MSQLLITLRQQLVSQSQKNKGLATKYTHAENGMHETQLTVEQLKHRIGKELKRLDLKTLAGKKQARHTFIESVLAWELGGHIVQTPHFGSVVKDVEESMSAHPNTLSAFDQLLQDLKDS